MKRMVKVAAVVAVLVSLMVGQSMLMAAPVQRAARASDRSAHMTIGQHILSVLAAVWGNHSAAPVKFSPEAKCAIWGTGC